MERLAPGLLPRSKCRFVSLPSLRPPRFLCGCNISASLCAHGAARCGGLSWASIALGITHQRARLFESGDLCVYCLDNLFSVHADDYINVSYPNQSASPCRCRALPSSPRAHLCTFLLRTRSVAHRLHSLASVTSKPVTPVPFIPQEPLGAVRVLASWRRPVLGPADGCAVAVRSS